MLGRDGKVVGGAGEGQGCATTHASVATSMLPKAAGPACSMLCTGTHGAAARFELLDRPAMMVGTHWKAGSTLDDGGQAMLTLSLLQ